MDHVRLSLAHIGKLMFVQFMEIDIPARNRGLFPGEKVGLNFALKVRGFGVVVVDGIAYCNCVNWVSISLLRHIWTSQMRLVE
jgi:phenylalanine ammonia-lyase